MKALTPADVAERLSCSKRYAQELMRQKDFPSFAINKSPKRVYRRVYEKDLQDWLEKQKDGGVCI